MSHFVGPELLADHHDLTAFVSGNGRLDDWLRRRAWANQARGASRTWVVSVDGAVVGYYASSTAVVLRAEASTRMARNQPDPLPAVLLGRLAIDQRWQGHGLGAALLKHFILKSLEVAQLTGVRVLLVHAKDDDSAAFYRHHGFEASPIDRLTMHLLVSDIVGQ